MTDFVGNDNRGKAARVSRDACVLYPDRGNTR